MIAVTMRRDRSSLSTATSQFLHSPATQRLSRVSLEIYQRDTDALVRHLDGLGIGSFSEVDGAAIRSFGEAIAAKQEGGVLKAVRAVAICRLFFSYLIGRSVVPLDENPMDGIEPPRVPFECLYPNQAKEGVAGLNRIPADSPENLRDRSLLRVMYLTGIWMGGLVALNLYRPRNPPLCTILPEGLLRYRTKGGLVEHAILDQESMAWLDQWLLNRHRLGGDDREEAIWITRQGGRILRATIAARIRRHIKITGLNPINDHLETVNLAP